MEPIVFIMCTAALMFMGMAYFRFCTGLSESFLDTMVENKNIEKEGGEVDRGGDAGQYFVPIHCLTSTE